ncbi:MAG TPA: NAD(P)/FAD-dependent oxidoreductase, partial [Vicinamibacterales bacterium]|nr:NAD(P)/FAD-dependent oxidoreductase [Vicinamibacterales bacterium]
MIRSIDTIVIGAGPAGLATSRALSRQQVPHVVLERGHQVGHTWANLYDSLVLHTARGLSSLPGLPFPRGTPRFPTRAHLLAYLERYAQTFSVPVEAGVNVSRVRPRNGDWIVDTGDGLAILSRTLVIATGIVANPFVPAIPDRDRFRGRVMHSVEYRNPAGFRGLRVLIVGAGNSAGEIASELAFA